MSTSNESALNLHSYVVKMMVKIIDFAYLALLITVYTPSIFCIAVFDTNGKYHSRNVKTKISDRSNVCYILVVLFHYLHAQANKQKQIIFIFYQENNLH